MSKIPFVHYKKDYNSLINSYFYALMPLLIFGFYKNGLLLYIDNLINFNKVLIPIYFYIISIIIGIGVSYIYKDNYKENILIGLICSATISINTSLIVYPILLFVALFISRFIEHKYKYQFNIITLVRILLILALLINSYSYLNIGEILNKYNYNSFDYFLGFTISGIGTSSTLLCFISLIILSCNRFYKKEVALSSIISFICISLILKLFGLNVNLLNGLIYFSFIFIATDIKITPYSKKGMIIYGLLIGILTSLFSLFNKYDLVYIIILIASLFIPVINKKLVK